MSWWLFLNKAETSPLSNELWNKVLNQTKNETSAPQIDEEHDPLLIQLPFTLDPI